MVSQSKWQEWVDAFEVGGAIALSRMGLTKTELSEVLVLRASAGGGKWVRDLVQLGADPNFVDEGGNSALSQCIQSSCPSMMSASIEDSFVCAIALLESGADPNQSYMNMFSLAALALAHHRYDLFALFLLARVDLTGLEPSSRGDETIRGAIEASPDDYARALLKISCR